MLEEIDRIQKELGFNSIPLLIHSQKVEDIVTEIKHNFEDITKTQIHSHLKGNNCLEIFVLDGDSERVKEIDRSFQASGKMEYVKLIVA